MKTTDSITARDYWNLVQETDDEEIANEDLLPPYTMEEIYERLAQSERDYAEGRYQLLSDALDELRGEFAREDAMKAQKNNKG
ncbi:MAG: hypothetical protein J6T96_00905 [Bacteroidales bacterium]|nr:hypothetical protein [Bacteroidales bacterium]